MNAECISEQDYQSESHANLCQTHRHNLNSIYSVTQFNKHGKFSWIEQHQWPRIKTLPPGYLQKKQRNHYSKRASSNSFSIVFNSSKRKKTTFFYAFASMLRRDEMRDLKEMVRCMHCCEALNLQRNSRNSIVRLSFFSFFNDMKREWNVSAHLMCLVRRKMNVKRAIFAFSHSQNIHRFLLTQYIWESGVQELKRTQKHCYMKSCEYQIYVISNKNMFLL